MRDAIGRALVSLAVGLAVVVLAGAEPVQRWFGAGPASLVFAVGVPAEVDPAALEPVWRERLPGHEVRTRLPSGPHAVDVEVIGAAADDEPAIRNALTSSGSIELRAILAETETARVLAAVADERGLPGVTSDVDRWDHPGSGRRREDPYLRAATAAELAAAIAELQRRDARAVPPPGQAILFEAVTPLPDAADLRPHVRSYVVASAPVIGTADIADAEVIFDPVTNAPRVLITFDEAAAERLADHTTASVGEKLAIVVDGAIRSAPLIQERIPGGRAEVTPSTRAPDEQLDECLALVAALARPAALPPGLTARLITIDEPSRALGWVVRLGLAAVAAILAWILAARLRRGVPDGQRLDGAGP